jgi:hypothetical protein
MKLLHQLTIHHKSGERHIELFQGDLTSMSPEEAVDILIVSSLPNNYAPVGNSLIAALSAKGISVKKLAANKAMDLRSNYSCWLSQEINSTTPGIAFRKILCFEPLIRGKPSEVVGDIFNSLTAVVMADTSSTRIAMPLVATGIQGTPVSEILEPLIDAAVHWLELGLPVTHLKIVEKSPEKAFVLKHSFSVLKQRYTKPVLLTQGDEFKYDVFVSYSHENTQDVLYLLEELRKIRPLLRVFLDRYELNAGAAWQQEIYEALDQCRKVITVYSPPYLASKVCKEEFNIAMFRHRDSEEGVLMPIYLTSANLPTYMKLVQFIDCREADRGKIKAACKEIAAGLK